MTTLLLTHPACLQHDTGYGHPERADRLRAIDDALAAPAFKALKREQAPLADLAAIERLHPKAYVEMVRAADSQARTITGSTPIPSSRREAGRPRSARDRRDCLYAVDQVMAGNADNVFCAVRPPGHHAEPSRAMGFCLFNTVAVAALHARAKHGAKRVAVVDFDVHHGNGTQAAFWTDKDLFYGSTHQMPLFPGTGALERDGRRQYLQRAARPRRRRRGFPRGLRAAHPAGARPIRSRHFCWSRPASTPMSRTRWPSSGWSRRISPG